VIECLPNQGTPFGLGKAGRQAEAPRWPPVALKR
jgi:hypothetical protein